MPTRTIRLSADADERLQATAKVRGYANRSVFLRAAWPYCQRCALRAMYGKNTILGQWQAHGRCLASENVMFDGGGFDREGESAEIAQRLESRPPGTRSDTRNIPVG
jgi:hypothetical protein